MDENRNAILHARKLREDQINKAFDNTETDDIEKARTVGETHPNGKWVWTEYKPGKYDWRAAKKGASKEGGKTDKPLKKESVSKKPAEEASDSTIKETYNISSVKRELKGKLKFSTISQKINSHEHKSIRGSFAKRGGSIGPMTATSAWRTHNSEAERDVKRFIFANFKGSRSKGNGVFTIPTSNTHDLQLTFKFELHQTYHPSRDLDEGYKTYWYRLAETKRVKRDNSKK